MNSDLHTQVCVEPHTSAYIYMNIHLPTSPHPTPHTHTHTHNKRNNLKRDGLLSDVIRYNQGCCVQDGLSLRGHATLTKSQIIPHF